MRFIDAESFEDGEAGGLSELLARHSGTLLRGFLALAAIALGSLGYRAAHGRAMGLLRALLDAQAQGHVVVGAYLVETVVTPDGPHHRSARRRPRTYFSDGCKGISTCRKPL